MNIAQFCVFIAFCLPATFFALRRGLHTLQLGSYQLPAYFRSLRRAPASLFSYIIVLTVGLISEQRGEWIRTAILSFMFLMLCIAMRPRAAKKPLVFTARVMRQLITACILAAGVVVLVIFTDISPYVAAIVFFALMPVVVVLIKIINEPLEALVRLVYTLSAKRMLCAMTRLTTIGITGSFGKTSVKHYVNALLLESFGTLMTPGSFNTPMGVVKTVRGELRPTHDIFICEMGARHKGDIKEICDIVNPAIGIITSIGEQHLETFKTLENIRKTKLELADAVVKNGGTVFVNGDCVESACLKEYPNAITYGIKEGNDYAVSGIRSVSGGMVFTVKAPGGERQEFDTRLLGEHSAVNLCGAIAVAHKLGIKLTDMRAAIRRIVPVEHRLALKSIDGGLIIDDSYNSNPQGSKAALDVLSSFEGYKILITPGMVELGEREYELNREFGAYASNICDLVLPVGRARAKSICEGLIGNGFPESSVTVTDSFTEAMRIANAANTNGKQRVILIENDLPDNY